MPEQVTAGAGSAGLNSPRTHYAVVPSISGPLTLPLSPDGGEGNERVQRELMWIREQVLTYVDLIFL